MILNKNGSSLMELIISIALISLILTFMMRLLVDLNDRETNNDYASNNQINRSEIIREIEKDISSKDIVDVNSDESKKSKLVINFKFSDSSSSKIEITKHTFNYTNSNNVYRKWTMEDCSLNMLKADVDISKRNDLYIMNINIDVYTPNENNSTPNAEADITNNRIDDILISYMGKTSNFNKPLSCLGYNC